jgi:predicted MFS family arabinose efflux permease
VRVAANVGVVIGPPIGGLLLVLGSWSALFPTVAVMSGIAWLVAFRYLPKRGDFAPEGPPERGSLAVIFGDRRFLIFLGSAVFAWLTYVAYEVVLPVSIVDGYGYEPQAWGFLVWVNPLLVTLFQVRLTRATAAVAPAPKLVTAMLVMGLPYLVLVWTHSLAAILFVVIVFVFGEMLWVPTAQAVVADLAPADIRGAYMGAFGSAPAIGFALAPLIGLQVGTASATGDVGDVRRDQGDRGRARRARPGRSRPAGAAWPVCCTGVVRPEGATPCCARTRRVRRPREQRQLADLAEDLRSIRSVARRSSASATSARTPRGTSRRSAARCRT